MDSAKLIGKVDPIDLNPHTDIPYTITVMYLEDELIMIVGHWILSGLDPKELTYDARSHIAGGCQICSRSYKSSAGKVRVTNAVHEDTAVKGEIKGQTVELSYSTIKNPFHGFPVCRRCVGKVMNHVEAWIQENPELITSNLL